MRCVPSRGVTLLELLVVLGLLGVILGVSGLALASLRAPPDAAIVTELRRARGEAIRSGQAVTARPPDRPTTLFLPDGRAVGPGVDPLTGAPRAR